MYARVEEWRVKQGIRSRIRRIELPVEPVGSIGFGNSLR